MTWDKRPVGERFFLRGGMELNALYREFLPEIEAYIIGKYPGLLNRQRIKQYLDRIGGLELFLAMGFQPDFLDRFADELAVMYRRRDRLDG